MYHTLVSIIVPCYDQAPYLDEALQSVLEQTYNHWECIIVNDGSRDATEAVAKKWVEKDSRFIYLKKENGGLSSARNAGIRIAQGTYILPLDADDRMAAHYVADAVRAFEGDASLKVVYCKAEKFGTEQGLWALKPFSLHNLSRENMIFCSAMYKKSDWETVGGYDVNMLYGLEDWEFWIAILKKGGTVMCLDSVGFYYRVKPTSMVSQLTDEKRKFLLEYMSKKHVDFFIEHIGSFIEVNEINENLKSKKFVMDLFCSTFFNLSIFGTYKRK